MFVYIHAGRDLVYVYDFCNLVIVNKEYILSKVPYIQTIMFLFYFKLILKYVIIVSAYQVELATQSEKY